MSVSHVIEAPAASPKACIVRACEITLTAIEALQSDCRAAEQATNLAAAMNRVSLGVHRLLVAHDLTLQAFAAQSSQRGPLAASLSRRVKDALAVAWRLYDQACTVA